MLKREPFSVKDIVRGDDGSVFHLPTLRALHARGLLPVDSPAYRALLSTTPPEKRIQA